MRSMSLIIICLILVAGQLARAKLAPADPVTLARSFLIKLAGEKDISQRKQLAALGKLVDPKKGIDLTIQGARKHVTKLPSDAAAALYFSATDTSCTAESPTQVSCRVNPGKLADGATYTFALHSARLVLTAISSHTEAEGGE